MGKRSKMIGMHQLPAKVGKKSSAPVSESYAARRTWSPVVVKGVTFKERIQIKPKEYSKLDVDPDYQRGRTTIVPVIVEALRKGGTIPEAIDVAERPWAADGKWWIMDGFQRASASQEIGAPIDANVYVSDSLEGERRFFLAKQNRRPLTSNAQVKAWDGPITTLLRALDKNADSEVCGKIEFNYSGGQKISAASCARGIETLLSGSTHTGDIQKTMSRCDNMMKTQYDRQRVTNFVYLLHRVFPKGYARRLPTIALAMVCREKWQPNHIVFPSDYQTNRLANIHWATAIPSGSGVYLDLAIQIIKRHWK